MKLPACLLFVSILSAANVPHFDVASVKPAISVPKGIRLSQDSGHIHYVAASFRELVREAYRRKLDEVEGPEWIDSARFNVNATFQPSSESQVPEMLQSLLAERFKLRAHSVSKMAGGYALRVLLVRMAS